MEIKVGFSSSFKRAFKKRILNVEYDCRVIFRFLEKDNILFVDIGTHDEVY